MDRIDNDGYYQDVDDARWIEKDIEIENEDRKYNPRRFNATPSRYSDIKYNPLTREGRAKFCRERHKIHENAKAQYEDDKAKGKYNNLPESKVFVQCKNCKGGFVAKKADRKRGWAKFCSKSCKAQY